MSVAADKGLSKLKEFRKAKKLSKVDDALNVADDAMNLSDDMVNVADNVADMVGDVAKGALDADLLDELAKSGVKCNVDDLLKTTPIKTGSTSKGLFADYVFNGNTYRIAYGTNGYIVSFYPID